MSDYIEIEIKEPWKNECYYIEHNMNCYPIVHLESEKFKKEGYDYYGVGYRDENNIGITHMEGFTGKIILIKD